MSIQYSFKQLIMSKQMSYADINTMLSSGNVTRSLSPSGGFNFSNFLSSLFASFSRKKANTKTKTVTDDAGISLDVDGIVNKVNVNISSSFKGYNTGNQYPINEGVLWIYSTSTEKGYENVEWARIPVTSFPVVKTFSKTSIPVHQMILYLLAKNNPDMLRITGTMSVELQG